MTAQGPQPPRDQSVANDHELRVMQAILHNCDAMGVAPEEAKRMAIKSVVNLRRAQADA
ncbi:hypothetical protein [Paracoccus sp. (in: a-proteobacteria)]|uniref:hypothetical protein n=1 Tax=Paracoccus sp. TaxID=267 RepID=UPI002AFECD94|nr:hypothetical protein [Paracoccus sp. (in: a-proteobacteria)]